MVSGAPFSPGSPPGSWALLHLHILTSLPQLSQNIVFLQGLVSDQVFAEPLLLLAFLRKCNPLSSLKTCFKVLPLLNSGLQYLPSFVSISLVSSWGRSFPFQSLFGLITLLPGLMATTGPPVQALFPNVCRSRHLLSIPTTASPAPAFFPPCLWLLHLLPNYHRCSTSLVLELTSQSTSGSHICGTSSSSPLVCAGWPSSTIFQKLMEEIQWNLLSSWDPATPGPGNSVPLNQLGKEWPGYEGSVQSAMEYGGGVTG